MSTRRHPIGRASGRETSLKALWWQCQIALPIGSQRKALQKLRVLRFHFIGSRAHAAVRVAYQSPEVGWVSMVDGRFDNPC